MKECRNCHVAKEEIDFYKRPCNSDGLYSYCKNCTLRKNKEISEEQRLKRAQKNNEYRSKNKLFLQQKAKDYYYENRENCLKTREKYRQKNKEKISLKEAKKRISDPERFEKNNARHLQWSEKNRETLNSYQRDWYRKNKEKRRAHVVLNRAIKSGDIMRPEVCSQCKKECKPDGHHEDYMQPLRVIWLCRRCHSRKSPRTVIK